jgi:hypothetical protein
MNDLQRRIEQIAQTNKPHRLNPPKPKPQCDRCHDTHVLELIGGTHTTPNGLTITATPDQPIYRPCECRHNRPQPTQTPREF